MNLVIIQLGGVVVVNKSIVEIVTEWDIVAARQLGRNEAKEIGFNLVDQARITTVISEIARNIYLYAPAGEISVERVTDGDRIGIQIIAVDKGQSITDVQRVMEGRFTASGGLGAGLSGVRRLMDNLEIQTEKGKGKGTIIKAEKWLK